MTNNTERFDAIVEGDIKDFLAKMAQVDRAIRQAATGASVNVQANTAAFAAQMQMVLNQIQNVNNSNPNVNVQASIAAAIAQLQLVQAQANNIDNNINTVHVKANINEAMAELQRVRKQAEDLAYSDVDVHVEVEAERALERFERIQNRIKRLETMQPTVEVNTDLREAMRELALVERELQMLTQRNHDLHVVADVTAALGQLRLVENVARKLETDTTYVDIKTDTASALAEMAYIRTQITQLDASDPTVDIHAETTAFMARLAALQARIEALKADNDVRIDADTSRFTYKMALLRAQLLALNRSAIINIEARIEAFQASIGRLASNIRSFGEVIGYSIGGAFTALLPMISPIIANIGALLGNLGVMIGLVGTQLTGLVFGVATAAAGAGGVLAMAIGNVKKLYDETTKLNAAQQEAKSAIDGIKSAYNDLVSKTEQPILAGITKGAQAASSMMQMLEPMFMTSAQAFDGLMQSFKQSLGTPPVQAFIEYLNTSAGPMLTTFGNAVGNLFQGLGSMMVAFAPITQHVADGFLNMSEGFAQWAAKLSESEKFKAFSSYFQENMPKISSMFGDAIVGVVNFFSSFGTSASDMMTYLVDLMARWREWTSTLSENQAFQNFLTYVQSAAPGVMSLIGQLTTFLVNLGIGMAPLGAKLLELVNSFLQWTNSLMQNNPIVAQVIAVMTTLFGAFMAIMPVVLMFKSLFAGLGTVLASAASFMGGLLMTAIRGIGTAFTSILPMFSSAATWFTTLASRALPMLASAFGLITGPVGIAIAVITALIAIGVALYQNWDTVKAALSATWQAISAAASSAWEAVKNTITNVMNSVSSFLSSAWETIKATTTGTLDMLKTAISNTWDAIKSAISSALDAVKSAITNAWNAVKSATTSAWDAIKNGINTAWNAIKSAITSAVNAIKTTVTNGWNAVKSAVTSAVNAIKTTVTNGWNAVKTAITSAMNAIKSAITTAWNAIKSTITNAVNAIKSTVTAAWNAIKSAISSAMSAISSAITSAWNTIKSAVSSAVSSILSAVTSAFNSLVSAVSSAMSSVVSTIKSLWQQAQSFLSSIDLFSIGSDIISGLVSGISSMFGAVKAKISELAGMIPDWAKKMLGIHSPSRVMASQVGVHLPTGVARGADQTAHVAAKAVARMAQGAVTAGASAVKESTPELEKATAKAAEDALKAMQKAFNDEMKNLDLRLEAKTIDTDAYVAEAKALAKKYESVTNATATVNAKIVKASEKEMKAASTAFSKQLTVLEDAYKAGQKTVVEYGDGLTTLSKDFAHVEGAVEKLGVKFKAVENEIFKTKFDDVVAAYKNGELAVEQYIQVLELMGEKHGGVSDRMLKIDKELATARYELAKQTVADIVANEQMGATAQVAEIERIAAAYALGTKQREALDKEAASIKEDTHKRLSTLSDEYLKKIQEAQQAESDGIKKLTDEYMSALTQRSNSIKSFASIFDEVKQASDVSGRQLIDNLRGQVSTMKDWASNMQKLAARGVNDGLIAELQQLGPKSAPEIAALNTLTDAELKEYVALWQEKSNEAAEQAIRELEGMRKETDVQIAALRSETKVQLSRYESEWHTAIRSITDGTAAQFNAATETMPAIGVNIIQKLMDGVSSMEGSLMKQVSDIASSVSMTISNALASAQQAAQQAVSEAANAAAVEAAKAENAVAQAISGVGALQSQASAVGRSLASAISSGITDDLVTADVLGYTAHSTQAINKELAVSVKVEVDGQGGGATQKIENNITINGGDTANNNARAIKRLFVQQGLGMS